MTTCGGPGADHGDGRSLTGLDNDGKSNDEDHGRGGQKSVEEVSDDDA